MQATLDLLRRFTEAGGRTSGLSRHVLRIRLVGRIVLRSSTVRRPTTYYGTCKGVLFELLTGYADAVEPQMAWSRIFFLPGPHEPPARLVASVIRSLLRGEPSLCSQGTQVRDYLYVEDVAEAAPWRS